MRRTRIVATLGPSTDDPVVLDGLMAAGVDVVRLNAAHSGPGELASRLEAVRAASRAAGREIGVLLDLPGPKLRVGDVESGTVLEAGRPFILAADECVGDSAHACVTYRGFADDVSRGDRVLLDDGRIELAVLSASGGDVHTEVIVGGELLSNKGVNVPGVTLRVDAITRYDRTVLAWAQANDVDWIGQSFVRSPSDVDALREHMTVRQLPICAKIEKHEAAGRIDEIVAAADAVMVARGDLGVETSPERVPVLQRRIARAARAAGKPVVIATEMLDSMRERPRPTRAEASDVANAIFNRVDAVMLSGETAVGVDPVRVAETMARIAETAEAATPPLQPTPSAGAGADVQAAMSAAVCELASDLGVAAIVTLTQSGATALSIARHRPETPIIAATPKPDTVRRLKLAWGVSAIVVPFAMGTGEVIEQVCAAVVEAGLVQPGARVALTAGLAARLPGGTDFIHVRTV